MPEVRRERTNWRDAGLSRRHRSCGWDCPALDIDFLMIEYDTGKASALVEYKNEHAETQYASHPTYQAMIDLGNKAGIPVIACRYSDDFTRWSAVPLNAKAREYIPNRTEYDEAGWVKELYRIRGREMPEGVLRGMSIEI